MNEIKNYYSINEHISCAGQPAEEDFKHLAAEHFEVIINLGLTDAPYALKDEAGLVKGLGMSYEHIPVLFDEPRIDDLQSFLMAMDQHKNKKVLIHCAANYRASVFTGLYLIKVHALDSKEIDSFVKNIWQPNSIWQSFIADALHLLP